MLKVQLYECNNCGNDVASLANDDNCVPCVEAKKSAKDMGVGPIMPYSRIQDLVDKIHDASDEEITKILADIDSRTTRFFSERNEPREV